MKRLITYVLFSTITFSVGLISQSISKHKRIAQVQGRPGESTLKLASEPPTVVTTKMSVTPNVVWDYDPNSFNPRGIYYLIGPKPKAFREFECLELAVYPIDGKPVGSIMIETRPKDTYEDHDAVSGLVTEHGLIVATTAVSDTQFDYTFDGYFVRGGVLTVADRNTAVLEGQLTKSKNGVRIAVAKVRFRVEYLGC
jgi:hypothetical protein